MDEMCCVRSVFNFRSPVVLMTDTSTDSCHPFLIAFYGAHLRLQLFSLPLQAVLCRRDADIEYNLEALWTTYSSAVEMLRLICRHPTHARLAQDSVHVMTAYCAKFLIKVSS